RVFAAEGASIMALDVNGESAARTATEIQAAGGSAASVSADMTRAADVERAVAATIDRFGRIDILCQNVGIYPEVRIDAMTEQDWDRVMGVNVKSLFLATKACL